MSDDVTIVGGGANLRASGDLLARAGFRLHHAFELEAGDRTPIILGELPNAYAVATQAIETGRHILIAAPTLLQTDKLQHLLESRKRGQAVFVWSERRYHPGYHFVAGLLEADEAWQPRYLRMETLCAEQTNSTLARWLALETMALLVGLAGDAPLSVSATDSMNAKRAAPDLLNLTVGFSHVEAFIQVSLGEAIERRETLLAAQTRKAFVDEMNPNTPIRLVEDEPANSSAGSARWLSCPAPTQEELTRQQCLAFLDATLKHDLAQSEANVWLRALAAIEAMDRSLAENGAASAVSNHDDGPRFRLIAGRHSQPTNPPSVA